MQSRRQFLSHAMCGCMLGMSGFDARARVAPSELMPLVPLDYEPQEKDERGLWEMCDRLEREIAASNFLIRDKQLNEYLGAVTRTLIGDRVGDLRIYPVRNPEFNASMFPNGMMLVHTGLLARVRNEAQLAAVIGHECGHYLRLHSIKSHRDRRNTSAVMAFIAVGGAAASGATGNANWYDLATAINNGLLLSVFQFSRSMESEADAYGVRLLQEAGYAPHAASDVWAQLIEERKASAAARKKKYRDNSASALSTHPPTSERMFELKATAMEIEGRAPTSAKWEARRDEYLSAIAPIRQDLIDEQIKLNDPGASLYLLNSLAQDGWDGVLRYNEGEAYRLRDEAGDAQRAADAYSQAVQHENCPAEAHRAHGYALVKAGNTDDGRRSLSRYLELKPDAPDAAMVRFSIDQ
jgi:beta-barrel assembly-enhancing protease